MTHRYTQSELDAANELLASARKMPNKPHAAKIKEQAESLALAILMGLDYPEVAQRDHAFMASFNV